MRRTQRGFAIFGEFKDSHGNAVRVQESSAADGRMAWVFCHAPDGTEATHHVSGHLVSISPHLTRAQARKLIAALTRFVDGR